MARKFRSKFTVADPVSIKGTSKCKVTKPEGKVVVTLDKFSGITITPFNKQKSPCEGICSWVDLNGVDPADATIVYDFSAKMKTTTGKLGKATKQKVQLGASDVGIFWYDDACFSDGAYDGVPNVVVLNSKGKRTLNVSRLTNEQKTQLAEDLADYSDIGSGHKSQGRWCASFAYVLPARCYRVASSLKVAATYRLESCCGDADAGQFVDISGAHLPDLQTILLHRFGGVVLNKANLVEWAGTIGDGLSDGPDAFDLAGQGKVATLKDSKKQTAEGISTLSGSIVGLIGAPECKGCCDYGDEAIVFDCAGDLVENPETTAAYGTFTFKYNQKKSVFPVPAN